MYTRVALLALGAAAIATSTHAQDTIIETSGFESYSLGALSGQFGWAATLPVAPDPMDPADQGVPGTLVVDGDVLGIGGGKVVALQVADVQNSTNPPNRQAFWQNTASRPAGSLGEAFIDFPFDLYDPPLSEPLYDWAIVQFDMYKPDDGWDSNVWMYVLSSLGGDFRGVSTVNFGMVYDQFQGDSKESTRPGTPDDLFNINGQWSRGDFPDDNSHPGHGLMSTAVAGAHPQWWEIVHDEWFTVQIVIFFELENDPDEPGPLPTQTDYFIGHPSVSSLRGDRGNIDGPYSYFDQSSNPTISSWDPAGDQGGPSTAGWGFQLSKDDATPGQPDVYYIDNFTVTAGFGLPDDGFPDLCVADLDRDGSTGAGDSDRMVQALDTSEWAFDLNVDLTLDYVDYLFWASNAEAPCP